MRLLILALCSLIFWNCYTMPYKSPVRNFPQREYAPEEKPLYWLSLYESVYNEEIGGHITFTDILNDADSSHFVIVLRIDNRSKTSIINIKPKLNTEQFIGGYQSNDVYIIFQEIDIAENRIKFQIKSRRNAPIYYVQ